MVWAALACLARSWALADQSVTLTWSPSSNTNVAGYKIYYGGTSRNYTNVLVAGNVTSYTVAGLSEGATYYFSATTVDGTGNESSFSNEAVYSIPASIVNTATNSVTTNQPVQPLPSLAPLSNLTIYQNAGVQTVTVTGIDSGVQNGNLGLQVYAQTSDGTIIPTPNMSYTVGNTTGTLTFAPAPNGLGTATLSVIVNNGAGWNNLATQTFLVTVVLPPVANPPPTFDTLQNVTILQNAGGQTVLLTNIASGLADGNQSVTVSAQTSDSTVISAPTVNYTAGNNFGSLTFFPGTAGTATVTVTVSNESANDNATSQTFTVTVLPTPTVPPTLNALTNFSIFQNSGMRIVLLTGISSGASGENQSLAVSAASSNPGVIPTPTVNYISPNSTGTLTFAPVTNAVGTAIITVMVNDGGASNNLVARTFTVTVLPAPVVNQSPGLDPIANLSLIQNSGAQTIRLTGISGGLRTSAPIRISAISSNPRLVPTPALRYASPGSTATLTLMPMPNALGTATITVTINNGGRSNNIARRTFTVTVLPNQPPTLDPISGLTISESAPARTITLSGITSGSPTEQQTLRVTASSSNPRLVPAPQVQYTSPATTALLTFRPATNRTGTATITVAVSDGSRNNGVIRRSFVVTVAAPAGSPTASAVATTGSTTNAAAILSSVASASGGFSFEVTGITGGKYVVQATSDLVHWSSIQTNTAPFLFHDSAAGVPQRFFRAFYLQ